MIATQTSPSALFALFLVVTAAHAQDVRQIALPTNDIVYDPVTQRIYASVPGRAGAARGNTITSIDPRTGQLGASVFIGSEPGKLAISDDGRFLYGHSTVRQRFAALRLRPAPLVFSSHSAAIPREENVARPRCKVGHLFRFRTAKKHHKNSLHLAYFTKFAQPAQVFMPHNNTLVHNCAIVTYSYGCR